MENTTPMIRQYLEIKKNYPGTILFFRLGDFYEMFHEDALIGSRELDITLTARQKESSNPIPMCGVPHHAAGGYISRLVKKGFRVAICEQAEPAGKDIKLVKREVVRIITPGTAIDEQLVEKKENIFLAALCGSGETFGISYLDLSTGEFLATQLTGENSWEKACADIESYAPRELLFPESLSTLINSAFINTQAQLLSDANNVVPLTESNQIKYSTSLTSLDDWLFNSDSAQTVLTEHFKVRELNSYGLAGKNEAIRAAAACLQYARETQKAAAEHINEINYFEFTDYMILDAITLKNLDIIAAKGENKRSLLQILDQTITGMGGRLLKSWLLRPSIKRSEIQTRQTAVSELTDSILRDKIRRFLKDVADLERLIGRINLGTVTPRELLALNRSLQIIPDINRVLQNVKSLLLQVLSENIFPLPAINQLITESISDDSPANIADGGIIRPGFNDELDELRKISTNFKLVIAQFEEQEKSRTGIVTLKVKFNNVFGYFIEVSKGQTARVPPDYERRQTLTNAERYTTPQLKDWEAGVLGAEERILELENEIFRKIRAEIQSQTKILQTTARALATLDALSSLAETAQIRGYVCPKLHDGDEIKIFAGRHPIVEAYLNELFVPNDIILNNSTDRLLIITGPNMGGKSTILRQVALIQILAQMGSFVPAKSAQLPIIDRIWTRVGASDDLASGRSTFMVEMSETASILHNATPKSLILLDEIGRGTSTFDGLSIAWAVAEYLHDSPAHSAKTLFATHYHELTELAENLPGAKNYQITAVEKSGEVVFLHKLEKGKANKSYGIAVAQLAGLPAQAITRAKEVLAKLEKYELAVFANEKKGLDRVAGKQIASQISLFAISNEKIIDELRELDLEKTSAAEAKTILQKIQKRIF